MSMKKLLGAGVVLAMATTLAACGDSSSIEGEPAPSAEATGAEAIVIGSSNYYSNEILAEIYAQALEGAGFEVQREFKIGSREVFGKELLDGNIDLFAEYTGPLLQYWNPENEITESAAIYEELQNRVPEHLQILDQADATDQDSYVVSREFSEQSGITSLADLAAYDGDLIVAGTTEFENRPNGPKGLKKFYDVEVGFTPIEDKGGPLTVKALLDGEVQLANVFSASPLIKLNDLVVLEDPEGMFLSSHVVPVASTDLDPKAVEVINEVQSKLSADALLTLNVRSSEDQEATDVIAKEWIEANL
ncbi:MAG: ABC transporter substrate-binding protein [Actinomycetaceae bacterium]|nr:ABC transporter substrate-binding protein [Actinomycetaceae bacterium]